MTRLDRVLKLLEDYDRLASIGCRFLNTTRLADLRKEKEILTQELIEHGCRRKN